MTAFTALELEDIDRLWRTLPPGHMWTGWAAVGAAPERIWIFRTRAHWRKFPLTKTETGYALSDETGRVVVSAMSLLGLLEAVEAIPGLKDLNEV